MKKCNLKGIKPMSKVYFKNWKRKSFSLFQVIKRVVVIAVLPVTYHLSADAASLGVCNDTSRVVKNIELEEVEVSAQLAPVTFSEIARVVSVIGKQEIESAPAESIHELLEYVAGIDLRSRGGQGVQSDLSIRGSSFDQVMILLNGINVTDPQTGHHNLNLPVSLSQIKRIEIVRGSASRVFGPNAFSGAINFITKKPDANTVSGRVSFGQHRYFDGNIAGSARVRKTGHYFSVMRKSSAGYIENTDFKTNNLYYRFDAGAKNKVSCQMGYTNKSFGANSFYTPEYPGQYEQIKTLFTSARLKIINPANLAANVYFRRNSDRFELFRDEPPSWYTGHNYHRTNIYGANVNGWFDSKLGKTAFGTEFRSEKILSNKLGETLEKPVLNKAENIYFTKSASRNSYSVFFEHSFSLSRFGASFGVLANHVSGISRKMNFFPGLDVSYKLSDALKVFALANKSLRVPTFTDLYYTDPTHAGNPGLLPETSVGAECGIKVNTSSLAGFLSLFYRNSDNTIDWVKKESNEKWQTKNLTNIKSKGVEIGMEYHPREMIKFIRVINIGYLYNSLEKESHEYISKYALDNIRHKFTLNIHFNIIRNLSANCIFSYQDRNGTYTEYKDGNYGSEKEYSPFAIADFKVDYTWRDITFFALVSNMSDKQYFDFGNLPQAGRWLKIGLMFDVY